MLILIICLVGYWLGGRTSAADSRESARIRADSARFRADPPDVRQKYFSADSAERPANVRRTPAENIFGGRPADPRGTGRSPRVSARIRAEPRRKVFRRANSHLVSQYIVLHTVK